MKPISLLSGLALLSQLSNPGANAASLFPEPINNEADDQLPMAAAEAAAKVGMPAGFKVSVFAAEPDIMNPIAMTWDAHGRLWVAENFTYAREGFYDMTVRDRILIFEGADGEGRFKSRKIFNDEVQRVTSVEIGHGGVWVLGLTQLLFIPDRNEDGVQDGPAQVIADGFTFGNLTSSTHNGLKFGPDGWLYGRTAHNPVSPIVLTGAPEGARLELRGGGIWRYHPDRKVIETLSDGFVNSWGSDWDEHGELFFVSTVVQHFWYEAPGAHFVSSSREPNPYVYDLVDTIADHRLDGTGPNGFNNAQRPVGGMIYRGDNWPAEYRGHFFTLNLFGHRMNHFIIERSGTAYVGRRAADLFEMSDSWFRGIDLNYGPDGGVFVIDWSDIGDYHDRTGVHRKSGRIYKVTYGDAKKSTVPDLGTLSLSQLVALNTHVNEWFPRMARKELINRSLDGRGIGTAKEQLLAQFNQQSDVPTKLRALWTLYDLGGVDEALLRTLLRASNEHLRVWAIRLLTDNWPIDTVMSERPHPSVGGAEVNVPPALLSEFTRMAAEDPSGPVRLALASALHRIPVAQRPALAVALIARKEDAGDQYLPSVLWNALIPLAKTNPQALAALVAKAEIPVTRRSIARRLAEDIETSPGPINDVITTAIDKDEAFQTDIVDGLMLALNGVAKATTPPAWDAFARKVGGTAVLVEPSAPTTAPAAAGRGAGGRRGGGAAATQP